MGTGKEYSRVAPGVRESLPWNPTSGDALNRWGSQAGFAVDLRQKANDSATSKAGGGKTLKGGKASLLVEDDELEGEAISLVVLDAPGKAIARVAR